MRLELSEVNKAVDWSQVPKRTQMIHHKVKKVKINGQGKTPKRVG